MTNKTNNPEQGVVATDYSHEICIFNPPSVFKGEIPFLTFYVESKEVGKLWGTGGTLSFEGDLEESAKIFFEKVIELSRSRLKE